MGRVTGVDTGGQGILSPAVGQIVSTIGTSRQMQRQSVGRAVSPKADRTTKGGMR